MPRWHLLWYAAQIYEDEDDELKYHKSLLEYLATLESSEGSERVRQILDAEKGDSKLKQDASFEDTLETMFGRAPEFTQTGAHHSEDRAMHLTDEDLDVVKVIRGKPTR